MSTGPDFVVQGDSHGTVFLVLPQHGDATTFLNRVLPPSAARWGSGGVAVEHRFIVGFLKSLVEDGWTWERGVRP